MVCRCIIVGGHRICSLGLFTIVFEELFLYLRDGCWLSVLLLCCWPLSVLFMSVFEELIVVICVYSLAVGVVRLLCLSSCVS